MQPIQDPPNMSAPTSFKGDKAYVGLDVLLFIVTLVWSYVLMPARITEAMEKMKGTPQEGKVSQEVMQTMTMGFTGGCMCIGLVISIFLWMNMIKGKKWAFIVMIIFQILGIAGGAMGLSGVGAGIAIVGLITGLVKLVYLIMRMIGKVGPTLV